MLSIVIALHNVQNRLQQNHMSTTSAPTCTSIQQSKALHASMLTPASAAAIPPEQWRGWGQATPSEWVMQRNVGLQA